MNTHIMMMIAVGMMGCYAIQTSADTSAARKYIIDNYYKPLPPEAMTMPYKAFDSLLDRWSWIVSRQHWESFNNSIRGQHTGRVGITIQDHPLGKRVIFVVPGGPAYYSGLMVGDVIESVNGELLTRPNAKGEYPEIRGENGTPVMLGVLRGSQCINVFTQRGDFHEAAVSAIVRGRTLAIQIGAFQEGLHQEFLALTNRIDPDAIDTVIIDVRDNGGGRLDETLKLLAEFVAEGDTLLSTHYRRETEYEVAFFEGRWYNPRRPLIVLQNGQSASASEVLAGGLKARASAIIVGERSYGKGRIQRSVPKMYFGSADTSIGGVIFTIATYRAGGVIDIDEKGLQPDVPMVSVESDLTTPDLVDVRELRMRYDVPTSAVIDSLVRIGGSALARHIWSSRGAPYAAILDVESIVDRLPVPAWRCLANHDSLPTMFSRDEEETIRRGIAGSIGASVPDSVIKVEPLEQLLQHFHITATPLHGRSATYDGVVITEAMKLSGMRLRLHRGSVVADYIVQHSAAYRHGVCVGDRIVTINRKEVGSDVQHAYRLLAVRGQSTIRIEVRRGQRQFGINLDISSGIRPLVTVVRDRHTGYIGLPFISMQSVRDARDSIRRIDDDGVEALIIDVRGASKGSMQAAAEFISYFTKGGIFRGIRPIITVDAGTDAAAEVIAYELQRSDDATIVGTPTAGAMMRQVTIPTAQNIGYEFTQAYDRDEPQRRVQPDHVMSALVIDLDAVRDVASRVGDVVERRASLWHSTEINEDHMDALRRRLPSVNQHVENQPLAAAIYGSAAYYFQLQPVVRMLRGVTER